MTDTARLQVRVTPDGVSQTDRELNRLTTTAEKAERQSNLLQKSFKTLGTGLSLALVTRELTSAVRVTAEFNKTVSNLSAITGAVGDDLLFLSDAAREFGSTTTLSASQAAEAFKLVASARPDLLNNVEALKQVTEASITLAEAAGITLPEAAIALTSSLTLFDIQAENSSRVINVLAASAKEGASEIAATSQALSEAGLLARTAGLSFEQANGVVQALAKGLITGAEAGTKFRNILIILESQTNDKFKPSVVGLTEALGNLEKDGFNGTQKAADLFGRENITAAQTLIQFRDEVTRVEGAVTDTNEAYRQASTNVDNLAGDLLGLASAYEGVQIQTATYLDAGLRPLVQELTTLLQALSGNEEALETWGGILDTTGDIAKLVAAVIAGRLVSSLVVSTAGFVAQTAAALRGSVQMNAYGQVVSRTTVLMNTATVASRALNASLALVGGPVGVATIAAIAVGSYALSAKDAAIDSRELGREVDSLLGNMENLRRVRLEDALEKQRIALTQLENEYRKVALAPAEELSVVQRLFTSNEQLREQQIKAGRERTQQVTEVQRELSKARQNVEALQNAIDNLGRTPTGGDTGGDNGGDPKPPTETTNKATEATEKYIQSLRNQVAVSQLAGKEAAILAATQRLGEKATADQIKVVEELSGALFDNEEASRRLRETEADRERQAQRLLDIEDAVLESITGVTSATNEQREALFRLAEQGRITGEQLQTSLLRLGGEEGNLDFFESYQNQLNLMEESTRNSAQIMGEELGQVFGPGGTLQQGIGDAAAQALVFGSDFNESIKQVGLTIASQLLSQLIQIGIQQAINAATTQATNASLIAATTTQALASQAAITAGNVAAATAAATAWATPAALASLASLGANAAPAIAAITTTTAAAQSAAATSAFGGFFANGGDIAPGKVGITQEAGFEFVRGPANVTSARKSREILESAGNNKTNLNVNIINEIPNAAYEVAKEDNGDVRIRAIVREEVPKVMASQVSDERSQFNRRFNQKYVTEKR